MTFWGLVYIRGGVWADRGAEFELLPMKMDLFTNIFMFINIKFSVVSVGGVCVVTSAQLSAVRISTTFFRFQSSPSTKSITITDPAVHNSSLF